MFEFEIQRLARTLHRKGLGLVAMIGTKGDDGEPLHRCFSTVSKNDMFSVLDVASEKISMMPVGDSIEGGLVNESRDELERMAEEVAECLEFHNPMILSVMEEGSAAVYAVGDVPTLVFMSVRMMTILKTRSGEPSMFRFYQSDN